MYLLQVTQYHWIYVLCGVTTNTSGSHFHWLMASSEMCWKLVSNIVGWVPNDTNGELWGGSGNSGKLIKLQFSNNILLCWMLFSKCIFYFLIFNIILFYFVCAFIKYHQLGLMGFLFSCYCISSQSRLVCFNLAFDFRGLSQYVKLSKVS